MTYKNRDGYTVEVSTIKKVEHLDGGCWITRDEPGWGTFGVSNSELRGFVPEEGDVIIVYTQGFSSVRGVVIDGNVIRYITPEQAEEDHEQWKKNLRLERLERYISHGDKLKEEVKTLHPLLQARMNRFSKEGGTEFWIDSAEYEMAVLKGTQALLDKVESLGLIENARGYFVPGIHTAAIEWIKDWWRLNTDKNNYNYKRQMELVPDFGDGHSGNIAGAAYAFAIHLLEGSTDL